MSSDQQQTGAGTTTPNMESTIRNQRGPFLRRCSISDPRLDILPKFSPDKNYNPFNRVLTGLFEGGNSQFSLNKLGASTESVDQNHLSPNQLSSQEHLCVSQQPKGSSAAELKSPPTTTASGLRKSATSISALFGSSPHHQQHIPTIPESNEDQGLMMSARPSASLCEQNSNVVTSSATSAAASSPQKQSFMGIFGRGFLSKPVLHSQEENYRYIMALDR